MTVHTFQRQLVPNLVTVIARLTRHMAHKNIKHSKLEIGHLNIYHLPQKVPDLCVLLNKPEPFCIFGVSETRLKSHIPDSAIHIPNFSIVRRDLVSLGDTGIAVYIHNSIQDIVSRRRDTGGGVCLA